MAILWLINAQNHIFHCAKSHFSPIKTENFNFFINKSLSYFSLRNPVLLSELPYFPKWPTYGDFVTDKCAISHFSPIKIENLNFFINKSLSYFSLRNPMLLSELPNFLTVKCAKSLSVCVCMRLCVRISIILCPLLLHFIYSYVLPYLLKLTHVFSGSGPLVINVITN